MSKHAVVTGGAGFLGSWLCDELLGRGWRVTAVDNQVTGSIDNLAAAWNSPRFAYAYADVTEAMHIPDVDVVYHLASIASPVHYQSLPIETLLVGSAGTLNALRLAQQEDARLVLASTSEVYGDPLQHPQREDYWGNVNPVGERSMYDEAKRYSEALTVAFQRDRSVDTGIVRIFNTYGPRMARDDGRMVPMFVQRALAGKPLPVTGDGRQTRSLCYVADTVDALMAMAESTVPGPVNVGNPVEQTVLEVAESIIAATNSASAIEFVPARADDPLRRCPDVSLAARELQWAPMTSWENGLQATLTSW